MDRLIKQFRSWAIAGLASLNKPAGKAKRGAIQPQIIAAIAVVAVLCIIAAIVLFRPSSTAPIAEAELTGQGRKVGDVYYPSEKQWQTLTISPVVRQVFHTTHLTEGKIAVDEDRATLVFSPYSGRVIKLLAKPGDDVKAGQPLFVVEAADMVQAQNDYINAVAGLNKARATLELADIVQKQNSSLYETRAVPLRDLQQSQAAMSAAKNDLRSAETALEVVKNRLHLLGKTDDEIAKFGESGDVSPQTIISSPLAGTVIQRKVGPGQYVNTSSNNPNASDATFIVGDLSTVWLIAYVRESEAPNIHIGQAVQFTVLAYPDRVFTANITYVATALDTSTRRLLVRAVINNANHQFKPEMFASVTILTGEGDASYAIPNEAVIFEGDVAYVWLAREDKGLERRKIKVGLSTGHMIQVLAGLKDSEKIVSKGGLFVDRAASGS